MRSDYTPMAPTQVGAPFHRDGWVYEEKWAAGACWPTRRARVSASSAGMAGTNPAPEPQIAQMGCNAAAPLSPDFGGAHRGQH